MKFSGEIAIFDKREVIELLEATSKGKALIRRQSNKLSTLESVDLSRITLIPDEHSVSLEELTEKLRKGGIK
ncbi:MAG: hypothetical protein K2J71_01280 [Oscillospiraceae bacterium]|nr:hypothetical protein [Oscillospiraceae bacterium]MDE6729394.1 hypothetical protein [Oscillospiraceae bacterium]